MFKVTKKTNLLIGFILFFFYQEILFHLTIFKQFDVNIFYIILFSLTFSSLIFLISNFFNKKANHIIVYTIIILFCLLYSAQWIYYQLYQSIISIYSISNGGQVFQFLETIINIVLNNYWYFILVIIPLVVFIVFDIKKHLNFDRVSLKKKGFLLVSIIAIHFGTVLSMEIIENNGVYSNKRLYHSVHAPLLTTNKFGINTMIRLDIQRYLFGFNEGTITEEEKIPPTIESEKKYSMLPIKWEDLIEKESDVVVKDIHQYFSSKQPTEQNQYTGIFKDKNLIVIVAEAFSDLAIDKNLTPNLYKLYNEGFQFTNFYTPLFPVSTADGEYMSDTSLIPKEGVWSIYRIKDNYMPFSYANIFKKLGYSNNAYHNNTYSYYKRDQYLKAMGYDSYLACGNGLEKRINCRIWPQSDLEMISTTVSDYIKNDRFLAYYMSVSGHLEYSKIGNQMVTKNWNAVKDLKLSDSAKSYLAANIEFDKAIGALLEELKKSGKDKDTVIAITGDHYPYGLTLSEINELSNYERDKDFEIHHMPFILWSGDMKKSIKITKVGSSLDVLPTIYNLFGVEYDSRLLMGTDLLSSQDSIAIFSNRSFIIDKGKYNSITKNFNPIEEKISTEEIDKINVSIYNKFKYSRLILEKDYYRKLYQSLGWTE